MVGMLSQASMSQLRLRTSFAVAATARESHESLPSQVTSPRAADEVLGSRGLHTAASR